MFIWQADEKVDSRENERDQTQSYDKSPYTNRKILKATWQHPTITSMLGYNKIGFIMECTSKHCKKIYILIPE